MNEFSYKLAYPGIIEIRDGIEALRLNMEGAENAVENVKRTHDTYYTEKAYQRQLSKYEGALLFLQVNG